MIDLGYYILDENRNPSPAESMDAYFAWFKEEQKKGPHPRVFLQVARHVVACSGKLITISTVYLGCDHRFGFGDGDPILWETMVFGLTDEDEQERWCSEAEALRGHAAWLAKALVLPGATLVPNGSEE